MRPAPKARTGPWRKDSPYPREISGLYVTAWSEVRVLPPEPIPEHQGSSGALGPIDTTVEPMFYRLRAHLYDLRGKFPRRVAGSTDVDATFAAVSNVSSVGHT